MRRTGHPGATRSLLFATACLRSQTPALRAAQHAAVYLRAQGVEVPPWETAAGPAGAPPHAPRGDEGADHLRGWQRHAASACDERALFSHLSPASRALLLWQAGPHSSRALSVLPTHEELIISSAQFRVLPLRPLAPGRCHCRGHFDALGDHRAACATAGVLPARAIPLERALARVCRKAGARVAQNVRLADMNVDAPVQDTRRIEVVCNGLPLRHGAQLAVDATIVSPVTRAGEARANADTRPGLAHDQTAQRKRRHTYPELERARRCRLVVFGVEVGGRWSREATQFVRLMARARAAAAPAALHVTARGAWVQRWSGILSVAAQRAFATSLLQLPLLSRMTRGRRSKHGIINSQLTNSCFYHVIGALFGLRWGNGLNTSTGPLPPHLVINFSLKTRSGPHPVSIIH